MLRSLAQLLLLTAPAWLSLPAAAQAGSLCHPMDWQGAQYTVCVVDLGQYTLKTFLLDAEGKPYGDLSVLAESDAGKDLAFAMNAGMYGEDLRPIGLYVEDGRTLHPINARSGHDGNFYLSPNGVFFVANGNAGILDTKSYIAAAPKAGIATQSGPMLVINSQINPHFDPDSDSRKLRNGVGVQDPHTVLFAISDSEVNFAAFAHLFRDGLDCANALFLDGSISRLYAPGIGRQDSALGSIGPIIGAIPRPSR